jgi:hypothetical protein
LQVSSDGFGLRRYFIVSGKADHARRLRIGSLLFQHTIGVHHQGRIKKRQAEIVAKGADDRNIAVRMHIAGVAPFHRLTQSDIKDDRAQILQTSEPKGRRTIRRIKAGATAAALGEIVSICVIITIATPTHI